MITINYPSYNNTVADWKEQLENLVMSHQLVEVTTLEVPVLTNGSEKAEGVEAINAYMLSLESYKDSWFDCACGS